MRPSGRSPDELRQVELEPGVNKHAEGSCLVRFGDTQVLCTASLEDRVPPFLRNKGRGWVTGEYGMLPRSTGSRTAREAARGRQGGRTQEIQRLIGRSLRAVTDLEALGERQITLDCDVIQADGGTRTAAITGAYVALHVALDGLVARGVIGSLPLTDQVAAVSCGIVGGEAVLDLDYAEDSTADADANFVLTAAGGIVEVQATAEGDPFSEAQLIAMLGARPLRRRATVRPAAGRPRRGGLRGGMARRLAAARLIVASHNAGKAREIAALLRPLGIEAVGAAALGLAEPEETGETFGANAALKARAAAAASGEPALADDSGLVVPALDGAPGIYSARWAGPGKDFRVAMARIETELDGARVRTCRRRGLFRLCALSRLAGRPLRDRRGARGWDTRLSATRPTRLRLRPDLRSRGPRAQLRRDAAGRETAADPQGAGLRATGGGLTAGPVVISEPEPSSPGAPTGLALYVHWPFCLSKCPYCDFNSHVRESVDQARWRGALLRELDHFSALLPGAQRSPASSSAGARPR